MVKLHCVVLQSAREFVVDIDEDKTVEGLEKVIVEELERPQEQSLATFIRDAPLATVAKALGATAFAFGLGLFLLWLFDVPFDGKLIVIWILLHLLAGRSSCLNQYSILLFAVAVILMFFMRLLSPV
ncbi:hypothetical protein Poli38472_010419 [Pythium oligandrum]|uniref:Crinkler effector protein N-terminal domain-containing protein n=1 Tax=Pythium oligandrum TaxID=41045 RepID=A0A8K1C319_PYTOL|nr:hypothetical protein Poli38472_010419 [Pythium oligandrum]|eukprot:TMW55537.1 hypothetical protein Poli38472_010419 [Pythium oligandrum]